MTLNFYKKNKKILLAVDCIIFGFNKEELEILLIQRDFEPEKGKWSLMGGFVEENESPGVAAQRVLKSLTGLDHIYMEQFAVFGNPKREPMEHVVSLSYFALINTEILSTDYKARWFKLDKCPPLIFDHNEMVHEAHNKLKKKAALYPILFELLSDKFTIPQITLLYEAVYQNQLDKRNFTRKLLGSKLLIKLDEKDKENSKKGAYYYKVDKSVYKEKIITFLNFLPGWYEE
jgi:8-oxo-dGTP diphosphatase